MSEEPAIREVPSARSASLPRRRAKIALIVIHADPRPAAEALAAFGAPGASAAPHYYVDAAGAVSRLVPETRAARHSGTAMWNKRWRNIDAISIGITLEHDPGTELAGPQLAALQRLLDQIERDHRLTDSAIVRWAPADEPGKGAVVPFIPPPPDGLLESAPAPMVLGIEDDTSAAQRFWVFLQNLGYSQRGGGFKYTLNNLAQSQAFSVYAAKNDLGAPLGPNEPTPVTYNGTTYNYQVFARDTIFNEGRNYAAVQSLNSLLTENRIPPDALARALLEASYASALAVSARRAPLQGNTAFHDEWRFHYVAMRERFGPAISGNYITPDGQFAIQVFGGDTLYTPMSDQAGCLLLSQTDPTDPEYGAIWTETYKQAGAAFDPNSSFHTYAIQADIGVPLTGVTSQSFEGTAYHVQVYTHDTLYAGSDGAIKRMSALGKPPDIQSWSPAAAAAPPPAPKTIVAAPPPAAGGAPVRDVSWPQHPSFYPLPSNEARQQVFGRFDYVRTTGDNIRILGSWEQDNIIPIAVPQLASVQGAGGGNIRFHKLAADQLKALWAAWEAAGLLKYVISWSGSYVPRFMRSGKQLSTHAFGCAFDINVPWNGYYKVPALVGDQGSVRELVPIANQHGFYWGGHFDYGHGLSDGMHFEWARQI